MNKQRTWLNIGFPIAAVIGVMLFQETWARSQLESIPYSQFQALVRPFPAFGFVDGSEGDAVLSTSSFS